MPDQEHTDEDDAQGQEVSALVDSISRAPAPDVAELLAEMEGGSAVDLDEAMAPDTRRRLPWLQVNLW